MNKKFLIITTSFLLSFLFSCRGEEASLQTLDEFAGISGGTFNKCAGSFGNSAPASAISVNASSSAGIIKAAVEQTLTAVPTNVQKIFFSMGGKIVVDTNKAQQICPPLLNKQEFKAYVYGGANSTINTCWFFTNNAPNIFVEADIEKIRHSLLRTFSYIYSQIIYPAAKKTDKIDTSMDEKNFAALKGAFLTDLNKVNPSRSSGLSGIAPDLLEQYVFAEAFDSYFCNSSTKDSFRSKFTNTWSVFNKMIGK